MGRGEPDGCFVPPADGAGGGVGAQGGVGPPEGVVLGEVGGLDGEAVRAEVQRVLGGAGRVAEVEG